MNSYLVKNKNEEKFLITVENEGLKIEEFEKYNPVSIYYRNVNEVWSLRNSIVVVVEEEIDAQYSDLALEYIPILEKNEFDLSKKTENIAKELSNLCQCLYRKKY